MEYNKANEAKRREFRRASKTLVYKIGGKECRTFFNTTPPQKGKSRVSPAFSFFFVIALFPQSTGIFLHYQIFGNKLMIGSMPLFPYDQEKKRETIQKWKPPVQDVVFFPARRKKSNTIYCGCWFEGSIICFSQKNRMNGNFLEASLHKFSRCGIIKTFCMEGKIPW